MPLLRALASRFRNARLLIKLNLHDNRHDNRHMLHQIRVPDTAFGGEADFSRPLVDGYGIKVFALLHSRFEEVRNGGAC